MVPLLQVFFIGFSSRRFAQRWAYRFGTRNPADQLF